MPQPADPPALPDATCGPAESPRGPSPLSSVPAKRPEADTRQIDPDEISALLAKARSQTLRASAEPAPRPSRSDRRNKPPPIPPRAMPRPAPPWPAAAAMASRAPAPFAQPIVAPVVHSKNWRSVSDAQHGHTALLSEHDPRGLAHKRASPTDFAEPGAEPIAQGAVSHRPRPILLFGTALGCACCLLWARPYLGSGSESAAGSPGSTTAGLPVAEHGSSDVARDDGPTPPATPASVDHHASPAPPSHHGSKPPSDAPLPVPASAPRHAAQAGSASPSPPVAATQGSRSTEVRADGTARANAVEQLALGHHRDALASYLRLAHEQPERPAYAALVRILERKLRVRCARQAQADGTACAGAAP